MPMIPADLTCTRFNIPHASVPLSHCYLPSRGYVERRCHSSSTAAGAERNGQVFFFLCSLINTFFIHVHVQHA